MEDEPDIPQCFIYLYDWFMRMRRRAGGNGFGPSPLTPTIILDFFRLIRQQPTPWEVEQIEALDDVYLRVVSEETKDSKA